MCDTSLTALASPRTVNISASHPHILKKQNTGAKGIMVSVVFMNCCLEEWFHEVVMEAFDVLLSSLPFSEEASSLFFLFSVCS